MLKLDQTWQQILENEQTKLYFKQIVQFLNYAYKHKVIYPSKVQLFNAFKLTPKKQCKVVILGQDPYHNENQADGLAFSVNEKIKKLPPSLKNIFKQLENETAIKRTNGNLIGWAKQGVLLLNSILTVEKNKPLSHSKIGWQTFTDKIIFSLNSNKNPIVFLLWGKFAINKARLILNSNHLILKSAHPSPFSAHRGFFGNNHFTKVNEFLTKTHQNTIKWHV